MTRRRSQNVDTDRKTTFYGVNFFSPLNCTTKLDYLEACDIKDILLNNDNGIDCRKGRLIRGSVGNIIHSLDSFTDYSDKEHLIIGAGDSVYDDLGISGTPVLQFNGLVNGVPSLNTSFQGFFWLNDGVNQNKKFDGTAWTKAGLAQPAATPVVADGGEGGVLLAGDYNYRYVYVYKNPVLGYEVESRFSDIGTVTIAINHQINISVIASSDPQVGFIRIYRASSIDINYLRVVELGNVNATYTDNIADASLGAQIENGNEGEALDIKLSPINLTGEVMWKNRMWGWKGSYLYNTIVYQPEKWYNDASIAMQPINIDPQDNQPILNCVPFQNMLVVFIGSGFKLIVGDTEPFSVIDRENNIGLLAPRSPVDCSGLLFWLAQDGIWKWDGINRPVPVSVPINNDSEGYARGILDNGQKWLTKACGFYCFDEKQYWLSCAKNSSEYNYNTFVYNFKMNVLPKSETIFVSTWSIYSMGIYAAAVTLDNRVITANGVDDNYVEELVGSQDFNKDVSGSYETRHYDYGTSLYDKRLLEVSATGRGSATAIKFTTSCDILGFGYAIDSFVLDITGDTWQNSGDSWADSGDFWSTANNQQRDLNYGQEFTGARFGYKIELTDTAHFNDFEIQYNYQKRVQI